MSIYVFKEYVEGCLENKVEPTFEGFNEYVLNKNDSNINNRRN